jgi:beta-mannosidase
VPVAAKKEAAVFACCRVSILSCQSLYPRQNSCLALGRPTLAMSARSVFPIEKGWQFKQADKDDSAYLPVAQFPTNVHLDLMHNNIIPDPFMGKNELDVQWIGEKNWTYKTTFKSPDVKTAAKVVLAFDGLDTFATVKVNGQMILETDNMFIPERTDITSLLRETGGDNELLITFESAYIKGCELVEAHPEHRWGCWNGDVSRLAVRKAQYHWVSQFSNNREVLS